MQRDLTGLAGGQTFDLLVVGGGINGAGIARDARLRGLSVVLADKGDWASGTSSRTSRLVHGGLRYLEHGRLGLVRQSLRERAVLLRIAPHLVEPLRFLAPAWGDSTRGITSLSLGVFVYDLLARDPGLDRPERLSAPEAIDLEPELRRDRMQGAVCFTDARCDDARLVLAAVRSAWQAGALAANYLRVDRFLVEGGRVAGAEVTDLLRGQRYPVRARATVNATGAWTEQTSSLATAGQGGAPRRRLRLTRGAHILVPRLTARALLLPTRDQRVLFVLPAGPCSILGTTDTDYHGDLDDVAASESDVRFLIEEASRALPRAGLTPGSVLASWAALRPLAAGAADGPPGAVTREHRIEPGPPGLYSVIGGKLTSFRALAAEVVDRIERDLGGERHPAVTDTMPLDGGDVGDLAAFVAEATEALSGRLRVPREHVGRLARTYGSRLRDVGALLAAEPRLLSRLCPNHPHLAIEAAYAARDEMAMTLSDFLFRRTRIAFGPCRGEDCADLAAAAMAEVNGWSKARRGDELQAYREEVKRAAYPRAE